MGLFTRAASKNWDISSLANGHSQLNPGVYTASDQCDIIVA